MINWETKGGEGRVCAFSFFRFLTFYPLDQVAQLVEQVSAKQRFPKHGNLQGLRKPCTSQATQQHEHDRLHSRGSAPSAEGHVQCFLGSPVLPHYFNADFQVFFHAGPGSADDITSYACISSFCDMHCQRKGVALWASLGITGVKS